MILAELDLPTILFGFITAFATAVAAMYKDMRKDVKTLQEQAVLERVKCDAEIRKLYAELFEIRNMPCVKKDCPLNNKK